MKEVTKDQLMRILYTLNQRILIERDIMNKGQDYSLSQEYVRQILVGHVDKSIEEHTK